MTLVLGIRSPAGLVLAADSQRTEGALREDFPKLFSTPAGIAWGTAGSIAIQQELHALMEALPLPEQPGRREVRDAIVEAVGAARASVTAALDDPSPTASAIEGLFGWYNDQDQRTYLLRVPRAGPSEFHPHYTAVGGPRDLARFALSRSEHLEYETLPLGAVKMVAYEVASDVIRASTASVGGPVQIASVTRLGAKLARGIELRGIADTVAAFHERQRDYIARDEPAAAETDTGVRP